jgi:DNA topoisomerase I
LRKFLKIRKSEGGEAPGQDPKTGKNIYVKLGRYGAMVQLGESDSDEKPQFAGLEKRAEHGRSHP